MKNFRLASLFVSVVLVLLASVAESDPAPPSPSSSQLHSTHKSDDSIDVSSSIGVSQHDQHQPVQPGPASADQSGQVEDLLANESSMEGVRAAPPVPVHHPGPASLSHAAVVDSESDLIGAESDSKFSFSKLKRPFARLPFDLRFNTRFLNGPLLQSGSNMMPQMQPPHPPPMRGGPPPQMMRQPPPPMGGNGGPPHRPFGPPPMGPPHHPHHQQQQRPGPLPGFAGHGHPPMFPKMPQGPPPPPMPSPKSMVQPMMHAHHGGGPQLHMDMEPPGAPRNPDPLIHTITEYIEGDDDGSHRNNEILGDYDRQSLSAPSNDIWPIAQPDLAKIVHLDVKCEKNFMKVSVEFDRPFNGIIFSKGHFSQPNCIHLPAGSGRSSIYFDIRIDSCGTTGNMGPNSISAYGNVNAGNFFENTVIFQYDPFVQEAWDQARKLRCTWHDQYEKSVSFRPFPVDMVDVVRADFAGDNVGCWMQIQVGRGPWASEVAGIVKIGQTMTMVLAIKDEENKFDMLVRNCVAHDGKRAPIELVDSNGCIVRPKLMSRFTKIKNFGSSASVLSYAHFQAFKFPDSMEVHFQCTIQICKNSCPEQCEQQSGLGGQSMHQYISHQISGSMPSAGGHPAVGGPETIYISGDMASAAAQIGEPPHRSDNGVLARPREVRDVSAELKAEAAAEQSSAETNETRKEVGVNKVIRVISTGDLSFVADKLTSNPGDGNETAAGSAANGTSSRATTAAGRAKSWLSEKINEKICMSSINFLVCFVTLATLALFFCTCSVVMCCRRRYSTFDSSSSSSSSQMIHAHGMMMGGGCGKQKKSAKEASLMNGSKKNRKSSGHEHCDYGGSQTVIPVMAGNGATGNYLSSTSVLSPRVQAAGANANGYAMYH